MDWFSWLSKTGLEPSLVYEYGLTFSHNELEQEDTVYFNHEFLQSMGISIAKHRLEILKLARKEKKGKIINNRPMASRLIVAIKRTKRYLTNSMRTLRCEDESSTALVVVPSSSSSASRGSSSYYGTTRWKSSVMKRNKKLIGGSNIKQERLLLTNGSPSPTVVPAAFDGFSSPMVYHFHKEGKIDEGYWSAAVEEIRWDTMFQDLKPN